MPLTIFSFATLDGRLAAHVAKGAQYFGEAQRVALGRAARARIGLQPLRIETDYRLKAIQINNFNTTL